MGVIAIAQSSRHAKKSGSGKAVAIIALLVILIAALVVFLCRDRIFGGSDAGRTVSAETGDIRTGDAADAFTYENGSGQVFAMNGNNLAIVSGSGLQMLDKDGQNLSREVFYMQNPATDTRGEYSVFYDVGGTELRYCVNGKCTAPGSVGKLISASVNARGWLAVTAEEAGYKGSVTVYNREGESVYKWSSGSGYPLCADVSPDCGSLSVLCLDETGSYVKIFRLNSDKEFATAAIPGKTCFKLRYMSGGNICVLSDSDIEFFSGDGKLKNATDFSGGFLAGYELADDFCAVVLSNYESGSNVTITGFASDGGVYGSAELSEEPVSLSAQGQRLLVYMSDRAVLFSRDMSVKKDTVVTPGYKCALLRPDGNALLLAAFHGELLKL